MQVVRKATSRSPTVTFWGAAQAVTGSMHMVEWADERFLLDCGLVMGWGSEAQLRNRFFPFAPASISAVLLSHAHVDHCGNLPNLVRQGFTGPILCTPATRDLLGIMLADSARIHENEAHVADVIACPEEFTERPLFTGKDVRRTIEQCVTIPYDEPHEFAPGVMVRFVDAGHLLGSAMIALRFNGPGKERRLTFTGDLGRPSLGFLRPPAPMPPADLILCESTYGGRLHQSLEELSAKLKQVVALTFDRNGKVLIPAFSLGRTQIVVHYLRRWMAEGKIPHVPIYIDSPLAAAISEVHDRYPECLQAPSSEFLRIPLRNDPSRSGIRKNSDSPIHFIRDRREARDISVRREACILVASGGMCEAGRIINHFEHNLDDPRNSVVLVSYQAPGSLGRKLLERGPTVTFRGRRWNKWADVVDLNGFSGHADQGDLLRFFEPLKGSAPRVRLVHGDLQHAEALAESLRIRGFTDLEIPRREDTVTLA
ncbi:MAG: MBL fold metallo-hydrolase [Planctomycetes bacterium]|nr:MBL fold metallo-hydrolase [Planctomycetota bacterium]